MSPIEQTSILAQPFALPTSYIEALHRNEAIAALDTTALKALALEAVPPPASSAIDLSPVAQFQSALAQSHQLLDGLPRSDGGSGGAQLDTLTGAAQNLVAAYNVLQTGDADSATVQAPLRSNLLHSVTQPNAAADASQAAGPATLADIGITLRAAAGNNGNNGSGDGDGLSALTLDAQALQSAYAANPQGTVALLNQTTGNFEQLGDQFAQQASVDAAAGAAAVAGSGNASASASASDLTRASASAANAPSITTTAGANAATANAANVPQDTLADLALTDALADNATATADGVTQTQLDQLDQQQQQQQLDAAREVYSAQSAALQAQGKTLLAQQAAQLQGTEQLTQKQLADAGAKTVANAVTQLRVTAQQHTALLAAGAGAAG
ncbi:hypothetical protein, partial [Rugamonas sp.]|uniref:hypothetical protein n=1 Tax=Rugamonas sp. TaxID=1926287 RepID=UPI0025E38922